MFRAREIAQQFKALATLAEDPAQISAPTWWLTIFRT